MKILKKGDVMKLDGRLGYFAWPSVTRLKNGAYIAVASGGRMRHIDPFGRVVASYSLDGEIWTPPGVVADSGYDTRDAGILTLQSGKVLLTTFYSERDLQYSLLWQYEKEYGDEVAALVKGYLDTFPETEFDEFCGMICESDDGVHFSPLRKITISSPHGPVQLKSGRIVYVGCRMGKDEPKGIWVTYSDDEGKTWSDYVQIPIPKGGEKLEYHEPYAIETEEGHLLVTIRVHLENGVTIYQCESDDGGKTFSEPVSLGINGVPPHLYKASSGKIVLTYGRREMPMGIRAKISEDNGKTWGEEIILTDDASYWDLGYPCTVERDDGALVTVYYQADKEGDNASIRYIIWNI